MRLDLLEIFGAAVGGSLAYLLTSHLPGVAAAVVGAVAIALLSFASSRQTQPVLWWASVGAIAGSVVGTATMLASTTTVEGVEGRTALRYTVMGSLALAGLVAGIFLGKDIERTDIPRPAELLKRASGLTAVLFAVTVTVTVHFPAHGLDAARTLSSRLSTTTTILVTSLAVPGWVGFLIGTRIGQQLRAALERRGLPVPEGSHAPDATPGQHGSGEGDGGRARPC